MRDWYDNPQLEELFQEQADCFPHGPLGTLVPVEVEMVSDLSQEGISLLRQYIAGEIAPMKVPDKLWEIKVKF